MIVNLLFLLIQTTRPNLLQCQSIWLKRRVFTVVESRISITSVYLKAAADHGGFKGDANKNPHMLFLFSWLRIVNPTLSHTLGVGKASRGLTHVYTHVICLANVHEIMLRKQIARTQNTARFLQEESCAVSGPIS